MTKEEYNALSQETVQINAKDLHDMQAKLFTYDYLYGEDTFEGICPKCYEAYIQSGYLCPNCGYDNTYPLEEE